jgi:hypothetical protein
MDFDVEALYAALDAQSQARGLSWQQAVREINALFERTPARPISASTVTGMRGKAVIEGDGVLQMLRWLSRTPESFVPGSWEAAALPDVPSDRILRFDARKMYSELDSRRAERGLTWKQVAEEIGGFSASMLTRLSQGGRVGFSHVMRITRWLGRPAAAFTRISER